MGSMQQYSMVAGFLGTSMHDSDARTFPFGFDKAVASRCHGVYGAIPPCTPAKRRRASKKNKIQRERVYCVQTPAPEWSIPFDLERCRQMVLRLNGPHEQQCRALNEMKKVFASMAFHVEGCRLVQDALDEVGTEVKVQLAHQLSGHILEAVGNPHANHVVQKVIEVLPPLQALFVVSELIGSGNKVVLSSYGVRIFCRLLEHFPADMIEDLIAEVTQDVSMLCCHKYGNCFARHLMDHDLEGRGQQVIRIITEDPIKYARFWWGTELILSALPYLSPIQRRTLFEALSQDANALVWFACCHKRRSLVMALLEFSESVNIRMILLNARSILETNRHATLVLAKLEQKLGRF